MRAAEPNDRSSRGRAQFAVRAGLCLAIIATGLMLRRFGFDIGLPAVIVKYGGSVLWGAMVYLLVALATPRSSWPRIATVAAIIAVGVELIRLVHTPWLDGFRLTLAGALLLGRIFSLWNIVAYSAGIGLATLLDRLTQSMFPGEPFHSPS